MHDGSTGFCVCSACSDSANGNNSLRILLLRFLSLFGNWYTDAKSSLRLDLVIKYNSEVGTKHKIEKSNLCT